MEAKVREAADRAKIPIALHRVEAIDEIMAYDVSLVPSLIINEEVVVVGRVPFVRELVELLAHYQEPLNRPLRRPA